MRINEKRHASGCTCGFCKNLGSFGKKKTDAKLDKKKPDASEVVEHKLTGAARKQLPGSSFALPKERKFPIEDKNHARNALARAAHAGGATDKKVKSAVHAKFPTIGEAKAVSIVARLLDESCLCTCPGCGKQFDYCEHPEAGMGYVGCPGCGQPVTQEHASQ